MRRFSSSAPSDTAISRSNAKFSSHSSNSDKTEIGPLEPAQEARVREASFSSGAALSRKNSPAKGTPPEVEKVPNANCGPKSVLIKLVTPIRVSRRPILPAAFRIQGRLAPAQQETPP